MIDRILLLLILTQCFFEFFFLKLSWPSNNKLYVCCELADDYDSIFSACTLEFPANFKFGVATAAYQIEGGWNESGKGENIWDRYVHEKPDRILDKSTGDIACDSYHKFEDDINILKWLGVDFYRFSISWSRLLPSGYTNYINPDGVRYYNELINGLLARNITPLVTLYHWDLPQPLQEVGGWPNLVIADYFKDYARVVFRLFGDRVKNWITFNEPPQICHYSYGKPLLAPGYTSNGIGDYLCGRTLLIAHAKAYRLYQHSFKKDQKGRVGITVNGNWFEPASNSSEDIEDARISIRMMFGWWTHPILSKTGDYPDVFKKQIAKNSIKENFPRSRLIEFTEHQINMIQGSYDFFGLNHYTSFMVRKATPSEKFQWPKQSFEKDMGVTTYFDPSWPSTKAFWLKVVPWGFRKLLKWIKNEYDNPEIIITENGYADAGQLNDTERINYHQEYMQAMLEAIHLDGVNVTGYAVWSLMDNFEWNDGYTSHFGLFHVDFNDPKRPRTAKNSAHVYKSIIKNRKLTAQKSN